MENVRRRLVSFVLTGAFALAAVAVNAGGCSSDSPKGGLGGGHRGGNGGDDGRGGMGGSIGGGGGKGGGVAGGTAGMAVGGAGGAGGQPGCQLPTGTPGAWEEIAAPPNQTNLHVTDAFAVAANDLFFAGYIGDPTTAGPFTEARILRWTQGCWTVELNIPAGASQVDFPSVHGLAPDDVWASAGDAIFHRDAQGWTRFANEDWRTMVRVPPFSIPVEAVRLREAAPNDLWVAVTSNVLHWNGQAWTAFNFDDPDYPNVGASVGYFFRSIWIDSPTSVWVGGGIDQVGNTMEPSVINHYDGTSWTHTGLPALSEVDAIARDGSILWLANPTPGFTILRFDGTAGMTTPIQGVDPAINVPYMTRLFARGTNDVWASGSDVAHFDGQNWSLDPTVPTVARSTDERNTYVTGDASTVWLATSGPVPHFFRMVVGP